MKRALVGLTVGGLMAPAAANAKEDWLLMPGLMYVSQQDSAGTWRSGLGFEFAANVVDDSPPVFGALAQIEIMANGDFRLLLGGQASVVAGVEVGASFRFTDDGVVPGFQVAPFLSAMYAYGSFRTLFEADNTLFGLTAGLKAPIHNDYYDGWKVFSGDSVAVDGRPLRDAAGRIGRPTFVRGSQTGVPVGSPEVVDAWTRAATDEHAAFGAFVQLSVWLERLGAPEALVERARTSAAQELRHAHSAFAIASRLAGAAIVPLAARRPIGPTPSLEELAVTNLLDGRLNEGAAARMAEMALEKTEDPEIRAHLDMIVREERGHADLATDIEAWVREVGGAPVAAALEAALTDAEVPTVASLGGEETSSSAFGRLTAVEQRAAFAAELTALRGLSA